MEERGKPPEYDLLGLNSGVHTEAAMRNIDNRRIVQSLVAALDKICNKIHRVRNYGTMS